MPDLTQDGDDAICPPTAQHATRQAVVATKNVVASLRGRPPTDYKHHDLGLVVDLGGSQAVAHPLNLRLKGFPAQVVTRGYHLFAVPATRTRARIVGNWLLHLFGGDDFIRVGLMTGHRSSVDDFEAVNDYLSAEEMAERAAAAA